MSLILGLAAFTLHCFPQVTTDTPPAKPAVHQTVDQTPDEERTTVLAAALYIANATYADALKTPDPAATLDSIRDAWPEIAPKILRIAKTTPALAVVLKDAIGARLRAYNAIEAVRAELGASYSYLCDYLAEALGKGADPDAITEAALDAPRRLRDLAEQAGGDQ